MMMMMLMICVHCQPGRLLQCCPLWSICASHSSATDGAERCSPPGCWCEQAWPYFTSKAWCSPLAAGDPADSLQDCGYAFDCIRGTGPAYFKDDCSTVVDTSSRASPVGTDSEHHTFSRESRRFIVAVVYLVSSVFQFIIFMWSCSHFCDFCLIVWTRTPCPPPHHPAQNRGDAVVRNSVENCFPTQNFTEIWQSAAELNYGKNDFPYGECPPLLI